MTSAAHALSQAGRGLDAFAAGAALAAVVPGWSAAEPQGFRPDAPAGLRMPRRVARHPLHFGRRAGKER